MRKYELKPMSAMTSSSYWMRCLVDSGTSSPQRSRTPSHVRWARYSVSSAKPSGSGKLGSCGAPNSISTLGPLGDPQRVVARLGHLPEQVAHLVGGLQVVLVALELEALRVRQHGAGLHAQQGVVGLVVLAVGVVRVVGGQQRGAELAWPARPASGWCRAGPAGRGPAARRRGCRGRRSPAAGRPSPARPCSSPCSSDCSTWPPRQPVVAIRPSWCWLEQLPVEARLVVVALEERQAGELDEVAVAGLVLGQQREVVVELLAALGVAAGVVDPAPAGRALAAVVVGHVGLGADDRLDALLAALLVELERPVHVAVVGDPDRRLPVGDRLGHQLVEPGGPVEHRELGVDVEVGERIADVIRRR